MHQSPQINPISLYIFGLVSLSTGFCNISLFSNFFSGDRRLIIYLVYIILGVVLFSRKVNKRLLTFSNLFPFFLFLLGFLLSFIPSFLFYQQNFFTSFIAGRVVIMYLTFPVLLLIKPTIHNIKIALFYFSIFFFVLLIFDSYLNIRIVLQPEKEFETISTTFDTHFIEGFPFVAIAFCFSINDLLINISRKNIIISLALLITLALYNNRSTLFSCSLIAFWGLLKLPNTKQMFVFRTIVVLFAIFALFIAKSWVSDIFIETIGDMSNADYNRNLAYAYFLLNAPHGMTYFLGNGFLSSHSTSLMQDLMLEGIYNSDVGLIGMWNQFGLLSVLSVLYPCFSVLFSKAPFYLKSNAMLILLCSLTIAYFVSPTTILWLCLFWYICIYDREVQNTLERRRTYGHN